MALPSGLVTLLLTDIEGSTQLWELESAVAAKLAADTASIDATRSD